MFDERELSYCHVSDTKMELPRDLSRLLFQELFCYQQQQQLQNQLDVMNGQPSRTTSTLTSVPATMRTLDQTFLEYQPDSDLHQNQAGFEPPLVSSPSVPSIPSIPSTVHDSIETNSGRVFNMVNLKTFSGSTTTVSDGPTLIRMNPNNLSPPIPTPVLMSSDSNSSSSSSPLSSSSGRKNIGGRRPNKEKGISPEEEEKRKQRRERNKLAAARCRKRRLDQTNNLLMETQDLESKKQKLHEELEKLKVQKQELQYILDSHAQSSQCHLRDTDSPPDVKPFILDPMLETHLNPMNGKPNHMSTVVTSCQDTKVFTTMGIPVNNGDKLTTSMSAPRQRPTSLPVSNTFLPKNKTIGFAEMANISITTPSNGLLNFDSLTEGGTGLTPISCSVQLRNSNGVDLSSPESLPNKLVSL